MKKVFLTIAVFIYTIIQVLAQNWDIQDGINLVRNKNYLEAARFFEGYTGNYPNDADGHYYLGLTYKELGHITKSAFHLKRAYALANITSDVKIAPDTGEIQDEDYMDIAQMYYDEGNLEQALSYVNMAEDMNPDNSQAYYLKAKIYSDKDNKDAAVKFLNKALQLNSEYLQSDLADKLNVTLLPAFDAQYYNRKGLQYYYGANLVQARANFEKAIALEPKNAKLYNNLGITYTKFGDIESAKSNFKKAIALNKNYNEPYLNLAKLEPKASEVYLKQALKANPNDQYVYYALGNVYMKRKDYKNAIKNFEKATAIDTSYFEPYFALAVCYSEMEDYTKAMAYVRKASELNNKSPELPYYLARLCLLNNRISEAQKYLEEAIRKGENPVYYVELGKIYYSKEDWSSAQNCFQKAVLLDMKYDNEAELHNYLGLCDYKNHDIESALTNLKKAVELEPRNIMYNYNLAQVYKSDSQKENYTKIIDMIAAFSPKTPQDYLDLAAVYSDRNNPHLALKRLNEGIERFPNSRVLYEAKLRFFESISDVKAAQETRNTIKERFGTAK